MNKIIVDIPLEPLEQRYTIEWHKWFTDYMKPMYMLDGLTLTNKVESGVFLDICGTNYFKASQLQKIVRFIYEKKSASDMRSYVFFFHDLWFPVLRCCLISEMG